MQAAIASEEKSTANSFGQAGVSLPRMTDPIQLVTGATGFLGSVIARKLLLQGRSVRALKRPDSSLLLLGEQANSIEWIDCDLGDVIGLQEAMQGVEHVYHAAAVVSFRKSESKAMMRANVQGTANLINAALQAEVQAFLHVSSVAALGRTHGQHQIDETGEWIHDKHTTDYGLSKHLAEREAWRGNAEGLNVSIINPSTIIGGGFWNRGTARFFPRAKSGIRFYTDGATGFVDVRDVADTAIAVLQNQLYGARYVVSGQNLSYHNLFDLISEAVGGNKPTIHAGPRMLGMAWRMEGLKAALTGGAADLTRQTARILSMETSYDNSKISKALDIEWRDLKSTISDTATLYKEALAANQTFGIPQL